MTLSVSIHRRGARGRNFFFNQRDEKHRGDEADHDGEEGIGECLGLRSLKVSDQSWWRAAEAPLTVSPLQREASAAVCLRE